MEDAFINIGMEEAKFFDDQFFVKGTDTEGGDQEKYTDFKHIEVPECLSSPPKFHFWNQFWPIFNRKYYLMIRSISVVISLLMPIIFITAGILVSKTVF